MSKLTEILRSINNEDDKKEIIKELLDLSNGNWRAVANIMDPNYTTRLEKAKKECLEDIKNINQSGPVYCYDNRDKKVKEVKITTEKDAYDYDSFIDEMYNDLKAKGLIPDLTKYKPVEEKSIIENYPVGTAFKLREGTFVIISGLLNSLVDRGPLHDYYWCVCVESGRCRVGQIRPFTNYMIEKYAKIL